MIHPTAIVDPKANLHPSVCIGPYCILLGDVTIEEETTIGHHVTIAGPCQIGKKNTISPYAYLGSPSQDKKSMVNSGTLRLGDRNVVREYATLARATSAEAITLIGNDNLFMTYVHIAHDCCVGNHNVFSNSAQLAGHVEVGDYVTVGGLSGVHQFCRLGSHSFCGGGSLVSSDVPPFVLVSGYPARAQGLNLVGLRRRGFTSAQCAYLKQVFHQIYEHAQSFQQCAQELLNAETDPWARSFLNFVSNSRRGIVR